MKQMHIAKELEESSVQFSKQKIRIRQQRIGELIDDGIIEHNGKAYVRFDDRDLFFELQGSGELDEFFVFGMPVYTSDRLLAFAVKAVRA